MSTTTDKYRRLVWDLGVKPVIARRGAEHGSGLGTQRWVVERAFAHLHWFRRLRIRWEIRGALPLREEVVRPQRTAKEKGKELRAPCHS
jgi:transposase